MPQYADLEIRIRGREPQGYPVELTLDHEQEFAAGFLDPATVPVRLPASLKGGAKELVGWFFADERLRAAWSEIRGLAQQRRIRLRIDEQAPELHALPWELLHDPGNGGPIADLAAANATPFCRYLAGRWQPGHPVFRRPLRILVAVATPANLLQDYGLTPVEVDVEWQLLQEATAGLDVALTLLPSPCTLAAIEAALHEGYHVLHFVGHGTYGESRGAALYLADEDNQVRVATDEEVAGMIARQLGDVDTREEDRLRLVFLASCQTAERSPAEAFRGLAPQLVAAGTPAVMAMQDRVDIQTARHFAQVFYRHLLSHGQVDLAANQARSAVLSAELPGAAVPVLFSRLRSNQLLGKRGTITSANKQPFWPFLLKRIDYALCTPFLGPGVTEGLLISRERLAQELADEYGYPMADRERLVRVAQFAELLDPELFRENALARLANSLYPHLDLPAPATRASSRERGRRHRPVSFSRLVEELQWAERVRTLHENEIHHLLAGLELPLYVTSNFDNFMVEALRTRGLSPRRIGLRWERPGVDAPLESLDPPPAPEHPVVLHLNGYEGDPVQQRHMVLSESDYLKHFVRIARDQDVIFPPQVIGMLAQHSFIFLGYRLDDWEFRTILEGLLPPIAQNGQDARKVHVGVQLEPSQAPSAEKAMDYLARYLGSYNIDIYWGTPQQFVTELHSQWQAYLEGEDGV